MERKLELVDITSGLLTLADRDLLSRIGFKYGIISSFNVTLGEPGIYEVCMDATRSVERYQSRCRIRSCGVVVVGDLLKATTSWAPDLQAHYVKSCTQRDTPNEMTVLLGIKSGSYLVDVTASYCSP